MGGLGHKNPQGLVLPGGFQVLQGWSPLRGQRAGQAGVRKVIEIIRLGPGAPVGGADGAGLRAADQNSLGAAAVVVLLIMPLVPIASWRC